MSSSQLVQQPKVLIIGANGFLGSHTTRFLIEKKIVVEATVRTVEAKKELQKISKLPLRSIHVLDLTQVSDLRKIIKKKFDFIINFAGFSGKQSVQNYPLESFQTNVSTVIQLLEEIKNYSPDTKIILISSILQDLSQNPSSKCFSLYGLQKRTAFEYLKVYKKMFGLQGTTLILGNVYGVQSLHSSQKEYNVINNFMRDALNGKPPVVFGRGKQLRDYLFIEDFVELIGKIIHFSGTFENSYYVGYGKSVSFKYMAETISKYFQADLSFQSWPDAFKDTEQGDIVMHITKTKNTFRWQPQFSVESGIQKCAQVLRKI